MGGGGGGGCMCGIERVNGNLLYASVLKGIRGISQADS